MDFILKGNTPFPRVPSSDYPRFTSYPLNLIQKIFNI